MEASREGHEDVVQLLVEHGANVNGQTEETQETALTLACCGGFLEVAQYLIQHSASPAYTHVYTCTCTSCTAVDHPDTYCTMYYSYITLHVHVHTCT